MVDDDLNEADHSFIIQAATTTTNLPGPPCNL